MYNNGTSFTDTFVRNIVSFPTLPHCFSSSSRNPLTSFSSPSSVVFSCSNTKLCFAMSCVV